MYKRTLKSYKSLKKLIKGYRIYLNEDTKTNKISWIKKLLIRKKGFSLWEYYAYQIDKDPSLSKKYISMLFDYLSHPKNGRFNNILGHKYYLPYLLNGYDEYIPEQYYIILDKDILCIRDNAYLKFQTGLESILATIRQNKKVICKAAVESEGGRDVYLIEFNNQNYFINRKIIAPDKLERFLKLRRNHLITEYVHQHEYAKRIFPHSTNSIRILTLWDKSTNQPFIAYAVHRFGNNPDFPVDNMTRGGGSSYIDLCSGKLEKYIWIDKKNIALRTFEQHPSTKSQVEGVQIPNWILIKNTVLKMAAKLPFLIYLGWDIVCTTKGFKILEINSNPSIRLAQLHKPITNDRRIDEFFRQNSNKLSLRFYCK